MTFPCVPATTSYLYDTEVYYICICFRTDCKDLKINSVHETKLLDILTKR